MMSLNESSDEKESEAQTSSTRICTACFSSVRPGSDHFCCSTTAVSNLIFLAFTLGTLKAEQVASGILKKRMDDENIKNSEFQLVEMITIGTADKKSERKSVQQISLQLIKELQIVLELSLNKTKQLVSVLRKGMKSQLAVESNVLGKLKDLEQPISAYYEVEKVISNDV